MRARLPSAIDDRPQASDRSKWVALSNTTVAVSMSALDGSIHLDPLAPGNVAYLLW